MCCFLVGDSPANIIILFVFMCWLPSTVISNKSINRENNNYFCKYTISCQLFSIPTNPGCLNVCTVFKILPQKWLQCLREINVSWRKIRILFIFKKVWEMALLNLWSHQGFSPLFWRTSLNNICISFIISMPIHHIQIVIISLVLLGIQFSFLLAHNANNDL